MYKILLGLPDIQHRHLQRMKEEHGLTYTGYIRWLLKMDIDRQNGRGFTQTETITTFSQTRRVVERKHLEPDNIALQKELAPILAKRREKADRWILQ